MLHNYANLKAKTLRSGTLFTDFTFPPEYDSLSGANVSGALGAEVPPGIRWRRPQEIVQNPKFISGGATRFDLDQGALGDCWFVSAVSTLAINNRKLFERCVPLDQSFDEDYAGIFRFNFWRYGAWTEVVVDDYLPTINGRLAFCQNLDQPSEFWAALLEKAYAKLHGCYMAIDGGHISDALVDFTGGISEVVQLRPVSKLPKNLYTIMQRTHKMHSMMGVSIESKKREDKLTNGLFTGHAYSITDVRRVSVGGETVKLLRIRNPWGRKEWNGPWADSSPEWQKLSEEERQNMGIVNRDDGEFWMTFEDMLECFTQLKMCHICPDAITEEAAQNMNQVNWQVKQHKGEWIRGASAGGCGAPPNEALVWKNPQYHVTLKDADDDDEDGLCTLVVSLMQKDDSALKQIFIGFSVLRLKSGIPLLADGKNYDEFSLVHEDFSTYSNVREVTAHFAFKRGTYVIIPTTYAPHKEGQYLLRIYTEKAADSEEIDVPTLPGRPVTREKAKLKKMFKKFTKDDKQMDAREFRRFLTAHFNDRTDITFGKDTALKLIGIHDLNDNGSIEFREFRRLIKDLDWWHATFVKFDKNKSGLIETLELEEVFRAIGFSVSRKLISRFARKYGGKDRKLDFEDFILCIAVVFKVKASMGGSAGPAVERAMRDRLADSDDE